MLASSTLPAAVLRRIRIPVVFILLGILLLVLFKPSFAQGSTLHPSYPLLDKDGRNVLESGNPLSTIETCGACHDTEFIEQHSFHADVGLTDFSNPGETASGRSWDSSPGTFGRWNPITYRYLSPQGDERIDLTTAEWIQTLGARHVGGGPAEYSRSGERLEGVPIDAGNVETSIVDPINGELVSWDWKESGTVEMNCYLCHSPAPNNDARVEALQKGDFQWASTATLLGTGIVEEIDGALVWNEQAFDVEGNLTDTFVNIQDPSDENCAQCHGLVHVDSQTPLALSGCEPEQWSTITTGQIVSPFRISDSGMNISSKDDLTRSWDIHSERVVSCTDCHYSLNNPVYYQESDESQPEHLSFDPRRIDLGEYLYRPLHQFAKGQSAQGTVAPELDNTGRRCESCHTMENTHNWLPYKDRHTEAVSCESCHIPEMYAPSRQYTDWTVLNSEGEPQSACRGIEQEGDYGSTVLINSYKPVLLPRQAGDGSATLAPHNLVTSWFWVYEDPERPVPIGDLRDAWFAEEGYHGDILALFDENGDDALSETELVIDTDQKESLIASRIEALGLNNPRIKGEIQPYSINHTVTHGDWATRDCRSCHGDDSLITLPVMLADRVPGDILPTFVGDSLISTGGEIYTTEDGEVYYQLETKEENLYILGHDSVNLVDWFGSIVLVITVIGVAVHGGLRFFAMRGRSPDKPDLEEVYMYSAYERLWHWLQTIVILILLFTGLIIHKPDKFGIFSFSYVVQVHNIMALVLVVNAALAAFYHVASGEIQQFLPRPRGFFDQAFSQTKFYLQGIFRGDRHPFDKTPQRKLNPLQQVTYFAILNVLLPLQILTGLFMWGLQRWPDIAASLGGLPFLSPFHTLISWLFASFIVLHVYLTTTGHAPMAGIKGMVVGWDEVEIHSTESTSTAAGD
jgi:thiosulfate reductase cytochrome b subunit